MTTLHARKPKRRPSPNEPLLPGDYTVAQFEELYANEPYSEMRLELVEGEIFEMPSPGPEHDTCVSLLDYALKALFTPGYVVRIQLPLALGIKSHPLPDVAVVPGSPRDYSKATPATALLVVEVSDSTLGKDTKKKSPMYAAAGILDYWVLDLENRRLIVHREPVADSNEESGFRYSNIRSHRPEEGVSPLAKPGDKLNVVDLLP